MIKVEMKCKKHPDYKGMRNPEKIECEGCNNIYECVQDLGETGCFEFEGVLVIKVVEE